jgi:choline-sulfatase
MKGENLLFILSDEHNRDITGCYGNDFVKTPHMDALAARGTRFTSAYCNCPICVPSRASLATGRYVHDIRCWDNAHPYDGGNRGWGHRLIDDGHDVTAIGKLHYRSVDDRTGFSEEIDTLHVVDGIGDLLGLLRREQPERGNVSNLAGDAGRGESSYTRYDRRIAEESCAWLQRRAEVESQKPWLLFVGFVLPHFPLVAPDAFFDLYPLDQVPMPRFPDAIPDHPLLRQLRASMNYADYFDDDKMRIALAAYHGMVSFLDHNIGQLLEVLEKTGQAENTRVIYTSDHGDNLGNRGFWGKSVMYDDAVAVPMIMAGHDIPAGLVVETPVSLVDLHPTFIEALGEELDEGDRARPGSSLFGVAANPPADRVVFSEYHAVGATAGMYLVRDGRYKLVYYVGHRPQLFDLLEDPHEGTDLGLSPAHAEVRARLEAELRQIVDPEAVNALAFADQAARVEAHGGAEKIKARGDFGYTPAPGQVPGFG